MKRRQIYVILVLIACNFTLGYAQNPFEVIEEPLPYSKKASSFTINIIGYNEDFVINEWQKYITDFSGLTYVTAVNKGVVEMESSGVVFPLLNDNKVNLYTRFAPNKTLTGVLLTVWVQKSDGTFFSSESSKKEAERIKDWLFEFQDKIRLLNTRIKYQQRF